MPMIATIRTLPAKAVAWTSIRCQYSSRPSPRRPRIRSLRPPTRKTRPSPARIARDSTAASCSPPAQSAAKKSSPSATENSGRNHFVLCSAVIEDLLHGQSEIAGERECEWKRRGVSLRLDRVDRLPRDLHCLRQLGL